MRLRTVKEHIDMLEERRQALRVEQHAPIVEVSFHHEYNREARRVCRRRYKELSIDIEYSVCYHVRCSLPLFGENVRIIMLSLIVWLIHLSYFIYSHVSNLLVVLE